MDIPEYIILAGSLYATLGGITALIDNRKKYYCQSCYKNSYKKHIIWNKKDGCKANAIPIEEVVGIKEMALNDVLFQLQKMDFN